MATFAWTGVWSTALSVISVDTSIKTISSSVPWQPESTSLSTYQLWLFILLLFTIWWRLNYGWNNTLIPPKTFHVNLNRLFFLVSSKKCSGGIWVQYFDQFTFVYLLSRLDWKWASGRKKSRTTGSMTFWNSWVWWNVSTPWLESPESRRAYRVASAKDFLSRHRYSLIKLCCLSLILYFLSRSFRLKWNHHSYDFKGYS